MIVAAVKNTSLTAEEAMLKRQQAIHLKELQLQQEKEELRIRTEIAKVEAEERVLSEVDIGLTACTESVIAAVPCEIEDNMKEDLSGKP